MPAELTQLPRCSDVHDDRFLFPRVSLEDFKEAESGAILVDGKMIGETSMAKVV